MASTVPPAAVCYRRSGVQRSAFLWQRVSHAVFACAELHEKQAELWDAFSKEARSNKTLAPYWELLAMYDGQGESGTAKEPQKGESAESTENTVSSAEEGRVAEEHPHAALVQVA